MLRTPSRNLLRLLYLAGLLIWISYFLAAPAAASPLFAPSDDFLITVKTDNPGSSSNTQFTIPTTTIDSESYNFNVDCDDANPGTNTATGVTGDYTCDYGAGNAGTYTIRISDNTGDGTGFPRIYFFGGGDPEKLLSIDQWGTGKWTSMASAFWGCTNLAGQALDAPNLSDVTDLSGMFVNAQVFNQDLSSWDVSTITNMSGMFAVAYVFNQDLSSWDVSHVTDFSNMFRFTKEFNQDISGWDTSSATTLAGMFSFAESFDQNIGLWDISNVTDLSGLLGAATAFSQDITGWDISGVTNIAGMFSGIEFNQDISGWNTANVTNMHGLFASNPTFNQDISGWNTSKVTDMGGMFAGATAFSHDITGWNTANVTDMSSMFYLNSTFNQDISGWNTSKVTDMRMMFDSASAFNQDIRGWDTSQVTNMGEMFWDAAAFSYSLADWDISSLTMAGWMFNDLPTEIYDDLLSGWSAQPVQSGVWFISPNTTYCSGAAARNDLISNHAWNIYDSGEECTPHFVFRIHTYTPGGTSDHQITIPTHSSESYNYNIDCDAYTVQTFIKRASGITGNYTCTYDEPGIYTIRIKDNTGTGNGFPRIYQLSSNDFLSIEQWGASQWTSMEKAFYNSISLTIQASDNPDLSQVSSMREMFAHAYGFTGDLSGWDTSQVTDMSSMFNATDYFNSDLSGWDTSNVTDMSLMFGGALSFDQDIGGWDTSQVTDMSVMFGFAEAFNQDLSGWDVSQVTDMSLMFYKALAFNGGVNDWDVSNVKNMYGMFYDAKTFNRDLSGWDVSSVTDMSKMFLAALAFNQNLGDWDVSNVTNMTDMFKWAKLSVGNYDALLNGWNTQDLQPNLNFNGGNSYYCAGQAARDQITDPAGDNWTIIDAGLNCAVPPSVLYGDFTVPADDAVLMTGPTQAVVEFDQDVKHDGSGTAADHLDNYLLLEAGNNRSFETASCAVPGNGAAAGDDQAVSIESVFYDDAGPYLATLNFNGGIPLPDGLYRLFICGTSSIENPAGIELNDGLFDALLDFQVGEDPEPEPLPDTGFAPGVISSLPVRSPANTYSPSEILLEIPSLAVEMKVVGVPRTEQGWDTSWLGSSAGWLEGSAYPTWAGNTVLTGHVWDAYNRPGPLLDLRHLRFGDRIRIHTQGRVYIYQVQSNSLVLPEQTERVFQPEEYDWLTLLTCESYNPASGTYRYRRMARAVLVEVR